MRIDPYLLEKFITHSSSKQQKKMRLPYFMFEKMIIYPFAPDFAEEIPRKKAKEISTAIFLLTELASPPFYKVRREKQANFLAFDKFNWCVFFS